MRSDSLKQSQIKYRANNREKVNYINNQSRLRNYDKKGRDYQRLWYFNNRNKYNIDNMGKELNKLFNESF